MDQDFSGFKSIAICGRPRVGKSTLGKQLSEKYGLKFISTDDYIDKFSFKDAPREIIKLLSGQENYIIEGVQVCRMLRAGKNENTWQPDAVIFLDANVPVDKKHVSLSALNRSARRDWELTNPEAKVFDIMQRF